MKDVRKNTGKLSYSGKPPWTNFGTEIEAYAHATDILLQAGLNWRVAKLPMCAVYPDTQEMVYIENRYAIVRTSDNQSLAVVGGRYMPIQNRDAFQWFLELTKQIDFKVTVAGEFYSGEYVWALGRTKIDLGLPGGDTVNIHLLLSVPHIENKGLTIHMLAQRNVSHSGIPFPVYKDSDSLTMRHRVDGKEVDNQAGMKARKAIMAQVEQFKAEASLLASTTFDEKDMLRWLYKHMPTTLPKDCELKRENFVMSGAYILKALEQQPGSGLDSLNGTWWGAVSALCFAVDHIFGEDRDTALHSAWIGRRATLKRKAFEDALKYCQA